MVVQQSVSNMQQVIEILSLINGDVTVPKNIRSRVKDALVVLNDEKEAKFEIKINKMLQALDEISEDPNVPAYTRTQIWNAVTILEGLQ